VTRVLSPEELERLRAAAARERDLTDRLLAEDHSGEALLEEYARENDLLVPVDAEVLDLVDVAKKKPLALVHSSRLRRRLSRLISDSLEIDDGLPCVEYVPGEYDEKGVGRQPHIFISPDLAERFPFRSRVLRRVFRALPKAEPTAADAARAKLKRLLDALAASPALSWAGREPLDEPAIREILASWYKDVREFHRRRTQGGDKRRGGPRPRSQRAADEKLRKDLGFRSFGALQAFMRPSRGRSRKQNP
jgi:hypothetical protein